MCRYSRPPLSRGLHSSHYYYIRIIRLPHLIVPRLFTSRDCVCNLSLPRASPRPSGYLSFLWYLPPASLSRSRALALASFFSQRRSSRSRLAPSLYYWLDPLYLSPVRSVLFLSLSLFSVSFFLSLSLALSLSPSVPLYRVGARKFELPL